MSGTTRYVLSLIVLQFLYFQTGSASFCDCGNNRGRPANVPQGVAFFDEDPNITEKQESEQRSGNLQNADRIPLSEAADAPSAMGRYMTDVIVVDVERVDGYADRDGLWNDSDPMCVIWYKTPSTGWFFFNQSDVVEGCNGQECDSVFFHRAEIPIPRAGNIFIDVEIWDDDGAGTYELLGKKDFHNIPFSGMNLGWRLLDDNLDWTCFANLQIQYDDNGIDNPVWQEYPSQNPTSYAYFKWTNPADRAGIHHSELHFSLDADFDDADEAIYEVYGSTEEFVLDEMQSLGSGNYYCAVATFDNSGFRSDYIATQHIMQWIDPTPVPPTHTPSPTANPNTPTPVPGGFVIGDLRVYADYFDDLGQGRYRARGNIRINDYVRIDGQEAVLFLDTLDPWIDGQGTVVLNQINTPVFIGDFEIEPVMGNPQYGIIIPGEFTSLLLQILGFYFHGDPISLTVNVVEGWIYCETLMEIDIPEIGLHVTHADFMLDWLNRITGTVTGFSFDIAGVTIAFNEGYFTNQGIQIDYFSILLPEDLGGGSAEAWGLHISSDRIWFVQAHIVLPVIRIDGGFEITGFNRNIGPEAWIEQLKMPLYGYKWCVNGRIHFPNLGDSGACGIETTFSIFDDRLQQACVGLEGCGLQIPIGNTGLFLYKLGGCITFNNLPYPDEVNQCAVGSIYDCTDQAITCCNFDYPDSVTVKLLAGLQGGPDIMGYKAVHADPLWIDINTGWGVGGGGLIKVIDNYEIGAGRVCVDPSSVRVNGYLDLAIIHGTLYLTVTAQHAEGAIDGYISIPPGDYWLFDLDEPLDLGHFLLMLGYYDVPQSDFWGEGIWSTCDSPECAGFKYGVLYSHEIFGQILAVSVDQNRQFYAWIDLSFFGSFKKEASGRSIVQGQGFQLDQIQSDTEYADIPVQVPEDLDRSLFTLGFEGGNPDLYLISPHNEIISPDSADNRRIFYHHRTGWRFYSIRDPEPGTWHFLVINLENVTSYQVQLLKGNQLPEISIDSVQIQDNRASIQWFGHDPDDQARVSLFYDTDNRNADGKPIATSLGAGQQNQMTNWDLSGVQSGQYYIYAKIEDGKNAPVISYYSAPVFITDKIAPLSPSNVQINAGNQAIHLWWNRSYDTDVIAYEVLIGEIGGDWLESIRCTETEITLAHLQNDKPYRFAVICEDSSGNRSAQSMETIAVPNIAGDLTAPGKIDTVSATCSEDYIINLTWLAVPDTDVSEYWIHYGTTPGLYNGIEANEGASPVKVPSSVTTVMISGLMHGAKYYFAVQSVDRLNNKSELSAPIPGSVVTLRNTDNDDLPDDWESYYFSTLKMSGSDDNDRDGLLNMDELAVCSSPVNADSDSDRVPDGSDPNPVSSADADHDGMSDDWEYFHQIQDAELDDDKDDLSNLQEFRFNTHPGQMDTDSDAIDDGTEVRSGTNPTDPDDPQPRCSETYAQLEMPSHYYSPGDPCSLNVGLCNHSRLYNSRLNLLVVLDVYGTCFFAPDWNQTAKPCRIGLNPGPQTQNIIPEFIWPQNVGHAQNIRFYAALTDPDFDTIIGEYSMWEFSW